MVRVHNFRDKKKNEQTEQYDQPHPNIMMTVIFVLVLVLFVSIHPEFLISDSGASENGLLLSQIKTMCGKGAVAVWDGQGRCLFEHNPDLKMPPASILKIVTASAFLHYTSPTFRFQTEAYCDSEQNLYLRGFGDPLMISEEMNLMAARLAELGLTHVRDIILDDTYFSEELIVPGVGHSTNPYDALNAALAVNFNTIYVTISHDGLVSSAEKQTPLTAEMARIARASHIKGTERVGITKEYRDIVALYGSLLAVFLEQHGVDVKGQRYRRGRVPEEIHPYYVHQSRHTTTDCVAAMMHYSNNFIANQLFLISGARLYGAPATLEKAQRAHRHFLADKLGLIDYKLVEGSGISHQNQFTVRHFQKILLFFKPYHHLLQVKDGIWSKTGTLNSVQSLAGYFQSNLNHNDMRMFVIMLPGSGSDPHRFKIAKLLQNYF